MGRQSLLNKSYLTFVDKKCWEIGQMKESAFNDSDTRWLYPVFRLNINQRQGEILTSISKLRYKKWSYARLTSIITCKGRCNLKLLSII